MVDRPLLYSAPMVRALRENRKTITRRTRGLDKINAEPDAWEYEGVDDGGFHSFIRKDASSAYDTLEIRCPYGVAGDRLWCKETLAVHSIDSFDRGEVGIGYRADHPYGGDLSRGDGGYNFRSILADPSLEDPKWLEKQQAWARKHCGTEKWVPAIFMPRWASRDTLEVISARPERLHAITEADAIAEGIEDVGIPMNSALAGAGIGVGHPLWRNYALSPEHWLPSPIDSYRTLWEAINGAGSWAKNPWVWRVAFRRVTA